MSKDGLLLKIDELFNKPRGFGMKDIVNILDEFFESNICIPKGETLQALLGDKFVDLVTTNKDTEYRIKPYEPIYEWQWRYKDDNTKLWTYSKYMTDEEFNCFEYCAINIAIKDEETKRIRQ